MPSDRPPRRARGTVRALAVYLLPLAMAAWLPAGPMPLQERPRDEAPTLEYEVKSVFLYHFTRYLQWPESGVGGNFEIAVLGDSAIVEPLAEIAAKKTVHQRPILIRRIRSLDELGRPQVLFVAKPAGPLLSEVLKATRGEAILTVGEEEGLAEEGLAVNFVLRDGAVKFEINESVLREYGIQPSSQLLKLAIPAGGGAR